MRMILQTAVVLTLVMGQVFCQNDSTSRDDRHSFDIMAGSAGISFGNGQRMSGLRFAWRDGNFEMVNGVNISFWKPYDDPAGEVNGISFGIVGPGARRMNGVSCGLGGVFASASMNGLNMAGLGLVSGGAMTGVNIAGLGTVAQGSMAGINISGLGTVSQGSMAGINIGGLGVVSQQGMVGINIASLGTVAQGEMLGFNFAGLGVVTQGEMAGVSIGGLGVVAQLGIYGVNIAGLGLVGQQGIVGVNVAGVGVVTQKEIAGLSVTVGALRAGEALSGISICGYKLDAPSITGLNLGVCWTQSRYLTGVTCAGYNETDGLQTGLVIGVVNFTRDLLGVQIGLLNYVEENPAGLKLLPIINAKFR
jgi:hypothetical protein